MCTRKASQGTNPYATRKGWCLVKPPGCTSQTSPGRDEPNREICSAFSFGRAELFLTIFAISPRLEVTRAEGFPHAP